MNAINAANQAGHKSAHYCGCEAKVTTERTKDGQTKTVLDAGKGNDRINIHTNANGSVNVSVNGQQFHFTQEQAQNLEIRGGSGDDCITCTGEADMCHPNITIKGDSGDDTIVGGRGNDDIHGGCGDDIIFGGRGDDNIDGGIGNDTIFGGRGDDNIEGGFGDDIIFGGRGDDNLSGGYNDDVVFGGRGDDTIQTVGGDKIYGGRGDDTIEHMASYMPIGDGTEHCPDEGHIDINPEPIDSPESVKAPETNFNQDKGTASWENENYKISGNEKSSELIIENKNTGEKYRIWGDPHVDVDGKRSFDFKENAVFKLDDGTEIHINTVEFGKNDKTTLASDITILDGQSDSAVQWSNLDQNTKGDMSETITTRDKISGYALVNEDNGLVFEEADGAERRGFEILTADNFLQQLTMNVGFNNGLVNETEKAL